MSKLTVVCCSSQNYPRLYSLYISVQEQFIDYTPFDENKKNVIYSQNEWQIYAICKLLETNKCLIIFVAINMPNRLMTSI